MKNHSLKVLIIGCIFSSICFGQNSIDNSTCQNLNNQVLIYSFENFTSKSPFQSTKHKKLPNYRIDRDYNLGAPFNYKYSQNKLINEDSLATKTKKMHGIYFEALGKEVFYSIGYEFQLVNGKKTFGWGIGTSFMRASVLGSIYYNQFSLSPFVFYEYGKQYGLRIALNMNGKINPIMYSNRLNDVIPPDKPPYYILIPSISSGLFYRTQNKKLQFTLSAYLLAYYSRIEQFNNDSWSGPKSDFSTLWLGLTIKYNLK